MLWVIAFIGFLLHRCSKKPKDNKMLSSITVYFGTEMLEDFGGNTYLKKIGTAVIAPLVISAVGGAAVMDNNIRTEAWKHTLDSGIDKDKNPELFHQVKDRYYDQRLMDTTPGRIYTSMGGKYRITEITAKK